MSLISSDLYNLEYNKKCKLIIICLINVIITILSTSPKYVSQYANVTQYASSESINAPKDSKSIYYNINKQISNPFIAGNFSGIDPSSQYAKRAFRFSIPLIAHVFCFGLKGIIIFEFISGILLICITVILLQFILKDYLMTFLWSICFSMTPFFKIAFFDYQFFMDCFSYLFVSIMILCPYLLAWVILIPLACFTDERSYLSILLVAVYFGMRFYFEKKKEDKFLAITAIGGIFLCLIIRQMLHLAFGLTVPVDNKAMVGLEVLINSFKNYPFALLYGFEFLWLIIPISIFFLFRDSIILSLFLSILFLLCALSTLLVYDVTRSACYLFPFLYISFYIMNRYLDKKRLNILGGAILVCCMIFPTKFFITNGRDFFMTPDYTKVWTKLKKSL